MNNNNIKKLSIPEKKPSYHIPEFSFTGDFLSFLRCPLQYRYWNKGRWNPTREVQLWFGEFIHKVMHKAYQYWIDTGKRIDPSSWDWLKEIRPLEEEAFIELRSRGVNYNGRIFCPYTPNYYPYHSRDCLSNNATQPHQLKASENAEAAIKYVGPLIFPFIRDLEVKLRGLEQFPSSSQQFFVVGIVDVLSAVEVYRGSPTPALLIYLRNSGIDFSDVEEDEFEIIIDYKAMRRPPTNSNNPDSQQNINEFEAHQLQLEYYSYLRAKQQYANPVRVGIVIYLNEFNPKKEDLFKLYEETRNNSTDIPVPPDSKTMERLEKWIEDGKPDDSIKKILDRQFKLDRGLRIIPINNPNKTRKDVKNLAKQIQEHIDKERRSQTIQSVWSGRFKEETCVACSYRYFCPQIRKKSLSSLINVSPTLPPSY